MYQIPHLDHVYIHIRRMGFQGSSLDYTSQHLAEQDQQAVGRNNMRDCGNYFSQQVEWLGQ